MTNSEARKRREEKEADQDRSWAIWLDRGTISNEEARRLILGAE